MTDEKSTRRKQILLKYNWLVVVGYSITLMTMYAARFFYLTSMSYERIHLASAYILITSIGFMIIILVKKIITDRFASILYASQFINWIIIFNYGMLSIKEIRTVALLWAFLGLVFLLSRAGFLFSLIIAITIFFSYITASYISINVLKQSGLFLNELLYAMVFLFVGIFLSYTAGVFRNQRDELKKFHRKLKDEKEKFEEADNALRESEEKYRSILDAGHIGYFEVDLRGNFTFCNNSFLEFTGYTLEEQTGMNFRKMVTEEDAGMILNEFGKAYQSRTAVIILTKIIRKDKQFIYGEMIVSTRKNAAGEIAGFRCVGIDNTERKNAEEALRVSEENYRHFIENANEVIYKSSWKGNFIFINPAFQRILDYTNEEIYGMNYLDVIPLENRDMEFAFYSSQLKNKIDESKRELPILTKSGKIIWIEQSVKSIKDHTGRIVEFDCIAHDITERKKAEEALRESEERYRLVVENIGDAIYVCSFDGHVKWVSPSAVRIWGSTPEKFVGKHFLHFVKKEYRDNVFKAVLKQVNENISVQYNEFISMNRDGNEIWIGQNARMIKNNNGEIEFFVVGRDITEVKKAADALVESEEKYRTILESMNEGYYEVGLSGCFNFANSKLFTLFGMHRDGFIGSSYKNIMDTETAERVLKAFAEIYTTGKGKDIVDFDVIDSNGIRTSTENSIYPIFSKNGEIIGFRGLARDVTERKKTEVDLKLAKEAAETANKAKSRFLASMSHELRTPLNVINGTIDLLRYGSYERDEEIINEMRTIALRLGDLEMNEGLDQSEIASLKRKLELQMEILSEDGNLKRYFFSKVRDVCRTLNLGSDERIMGSLDAITRHVDSEEKDVFSSYKRIKESGDYLLGLIDTILNLSKIESGKIEIKKSEVNVRDMVDSVVMNARSYAKSKGKEYIHIEYSVYESVPAKVNLDNQKIRQVLLNILSNAVKFTEEGNVKIIVERNGDMVNFSVTDTGMGIQEVDKGKIFVDFERTETVRNIEGTGLGLAISKRLIELQNGVMGFESEYGKGSKFWFAIPF